MSDFQVGIIGCGNISSAYLQLAPLFKGYRITQIADVDEARARQQATLFDCQAQAVDQLLANPDINLVVNLTVPNAHFDVSEKIIRAKKHVYSEKPFVMSVKDGQSLLQLAEHNGVRVGSAPDTFLGGAHQSARKVIDSGKVGEIKSGRCVYQSSGMESWHPQPDFFFQQGGGPILDMGPYYISNLVQLLGPVAHITAMGSKGFKERVVGCEPRIGERIPVEVDTTVFAVLEFEQGAQVSFSASWDVQADRREETWLYGTGGSLSIPDPNSFGGSAMLHNNEEEQEIVPFPSLSKLNYEDQSGRMVANYRGVGLADMVVAIQQERVHRCNAEMALHVIDVLSGIYESAQTRRFVVPTTRCECPEMLTDELAKTLLV